MRALRLLQWLRHCSALCAGHDYSQGAPNLSRAYRPCRSGTKFA